MKSLNDIMIEQMFTLEHKADDRQRNISDYCYSSLKNTSIILADVTSRRPFNGRMVTMLLEV